MWQNHVLGVVQWLFALALIPTLRHKTHKPALSTCIQNATLLVVVVVVYLSVGWYHSASATAFITIGWVVLAYQRYQLNQTEMGKNTPLRKMIMEILYP